MSTTEAERKASFKKSIDLQSGRRRRQETMTQIRKNKKEENLMKRRFGATNNASAMSSEPKEDETQSKPKPTVADIPNFVNVIFNPNSSNDRLLESVRGIRRILSVERNPPVDEVLSTGILPYLVRFLQKYDSSLLIFESSWALTNIASTLRTNDVVEAGAVGPLITLLSHEVADVREQAVWCLGNIAGDSAHLRDLVLDQGILPAMMLNLQNPDNTSLLNNVVWVLSNLCRGKPAVDMSIVGPVIQPLVHLLQSDVVGNNVKVSIDVKIDAVWALAYISDGSNNRIQKVMETNITNKLVECLSQNSTQILTPVVRCLGNFVSGDNEQTQGVLDAGILQYVVPLMENRKASIRKETCWLLSNVAAGTVEQIEKLFKQDRVIETIVSNALDAAWAIRKEAIWTVANICTTGTDFQLMRVVESRGLQALSDVLTSSQSDAKMLVVALEAIARVLEVGKNHGKGYDFRLDEYDGIQKIESLQEHPNDEVYDEAVKIIENYFGEEEAVDENVAPETNIDGTYAFGITPSKQLFPEDGPQTFNLSGANPGSPAHPIMFGSPSNSFLSH